MTFVYPAVFTPHEKDNGFHVEFPDLECCYGEGDTLDDAIDDSNEAARNWLSLELTEEEKKDINEKVNDDLVVDFIVRNVN